VYSREDTILIKKKFWTTLGQYLSHNLSAEGNKTNWINYRTDFKHIYFRMNVDKKSAYIGIELHHPDEEIQELFYEQFLELKSYLHSILEEEWIWQPLIFDNEAGKIVSRIYSIQNGSKINNQNDWPSLISFLKIRIIKLDEFWSNAKYSFEALR
jgi:hypothetical protein